MPRPIKAGDLSQGHCWFPTPSIAAAGIASRVFIDGRLPIVVGDSYVPHIPGCTPIPTTHPVQAIVGSPNVFIGGLQVVRDGDPLSCGDVANTFEGTVFCNGGGLGPQGQADPGQTIGFSTGLPVVTYPIVTFTYTTVPNTDPRQFYRGCDGEFSPDIYSPLFEEGTGIQYRNYPGQPHSTQSGGIGLPSYATASARNPIPILGMNFQVNDGTSVRTVTNGDLGNGISIDSAGRIFGRMTSNFTTKELTVSARNFVGESRTIVVTIRQQEVSQC